MTTAKDVTAALRLLFPVPVRLSTRKVDSPARFLVRMPSSPANLFAGQAGEDFLSRHLGAKVTILDTRNISRRDCGRDVEFTIALGGG